MFTKFKILDNGNLEISLHEDVTKQDIKELKKLRRKLSSIEMLAELCEHQFCNGYSLVAPEHIGAMTSAPIIADDFINEESTPEEIKQAKVWWFPMYDTRDEIGEILEGKKVVFEKSK